jgi:tRNA U55 pseudouridine synthase TruB
MSFLVRTRAGAFKISGSLTLEEIQSAVLEGSKKKVLIDMDEALSKLPAVVVKAGAVSAVASGSKLYLPGVDRLPPGLTEKNLVRLVGPEGLLAVAETILDPADRNRFIFKPVCVLAR